MCLICMSGKKVDAITLTNTRRKVMSKQDRRNQVHPPSLDTLIRASPL